MIRPVLVTPPSVEPVTAAEAKAHLRVDFSDDDAMISAIIGAAVAHLDGWTGLLGRCMVNQVWRQDFCYWPVSGCLRLPFPDVSNVVVKYSDTDNVEQTVSATLYDVLEDERSAFVRLKDTFTSPSLYDDRVDAVRVTFTAGYGAAGSNVPAALRSAVLLLVGHFYQHREAVTGGQRAELPLGVAALIGPYRRIGV